MIVATSMEFDAAHFLPRYEGKCRNLHGHHWKIELGVEGDVDKESGMVIDFVVIKEFLKHLEELLDHTCLNDKIENPTAENICLFVGKKLSEFEFSGDIVEALVEWIKVWETEDSYALLSY